jgi:hypothetical protein
MKKRVVYESQQGEISSSNLTFWNFPMKEEVQGIRAAAGEGR